MNAKFQEAAMEKMFVKGHLKSRADISAKNIVNFLNKLSTLCDMKIFFGPIVKTPDSYDKETYKRLGRPPRDVNAVIMWTDSGVQMYIFPKKDNWFTIDIYSCKKFNKDKVLEFIANYLEVDGDVQYATQTASNFSPWINYPG